MTEAGKGGIPVVNPRRRGYSLTLAGEVVQFDPRGRGVSVREWLL